MKKLMFMFFGLLLSASAMAIGDQKVPSKVEKVTVFLGGAQVTRSANVSIPAGQSTITFEGLSADIDVESLQVHADGPFTILSVKSQANYLNVQTRLQQVVDLLTQQKTLRDKLGMQNDILSVYKQEEQLLARNQVVSGQNTGLDILKLKAALDFQTERLLGLKKKEQDTNNQIIELNAQIQKYNRQIDDITKGEAKTTADVIVTVSAKTIVFASFTISYMVHNAAWYPSYDIRAKDVNSPLNIAYKANVYQKCGEDWKGVKLTLSTANPSVNAIKPELKPWYLNFGVTYNFQTESIGKVSGSVTDNMGAVLSGAIIRVKGTSIATVSDANGNYSIQLPKGDNIVLQFVELGYQPSEQRVTSATMNAILVSQVQSVQQISVRYAMDTVEYKASAYKVLEKTSINELLKKMEGFDVGSDGSVTRQGQQIASVRLNGKDFSSGDVATAMKNLPADVIESMQVIDDYGDQANMTGIKTGEPRKILNFTTKDKNYFSVSTPLDVQENERQTNFEFDIANPYDIPSDGKQYAVEIGNYDLNASFQYYVAPKLNTDVFLTSQLVDWNKYNFLSGEANLFFEGTYIGKSLLDTRASGDTLNLSLGVDKNIVVTRTLQKNLTQRQAIGSNIKETKDWVVEVKNRKNQPINLLVEDQVPVSQNTGIEVEKQELSGGKVNDDSGKVQWVLKLAPADDKKLELRYQVKYPKNQQVIVQ